ncbi:MULTISPECIES: hypothetical protein [unclassified Sphingopyxis]|uniref:hypothetical protein n=1 Tax=unclassified Sphingopyxis TaxID=2614943 RepID=UPI00285D8AD5|nr:MULTISPECIES: hypothetical protein [unclassified Sphingopyxis]MDR7062029.1 hypothetical protein [Sphingopyxis sp. BE235]MDR7182487.1 hypothetical protein [Sphingopyxis sp. BE249]
MSDSIDDLLGAPPEPTNREERRLRAAEALAKETAIKAAGRGGTFVDQGVLKRPVSQNFLAEVFDMDPATVRKRLVRCPKLGHAGGNRPVYDFKTACSFLLPPRMTADEFIKTLHHAKLPPEVNKVFWQAQRERLRFLRDAGEVWHTSDVLTLLGGVNMTFKDRIDMWVEDIRDLKGISDEHVEKIEQMAHALRSSLYEALVSAPARGETLSLRDGEDPLAPGDTPETEFALEVISDALSS